MAISTPLDEPVPRWRDVGAGLCVAGILLPEAVAYAGLAHLPVPHALAATLAGLLIYALCGGSRFAIVAPTSSTATLAAATAISLTGTLGSAEPAAYTQAFMALVLLCGAILMLLALARQGQLSSYISRPVLKGFAFGLAVTIVIKQLPDALGLELPASVDADPASLLIFAATHLRLWHGPSIAMALVAAALLIALKRLPQVPGAMAVIVLAISAGYGLQLQTLGIREVGVVDPVALHVGLPQLSYQDWMRTAELAFGLVMLVFAESWGSIRSLALSHGDSVNANRELLVLGACNVGSALLQGMAVGAGFSATSANAAAGALSRKSGLVAFVMISLVLLLALPALQYLPRPVLAVAVISALWHALSPKPLLAVWRLNRDRLLIVGAALAVLVFGVLHGMLGAIGLSLMAALQRFSQPVLHELGALAATRNYVDVNTQKDAAAVADLLILRPEVPLFFGSAERVVAEVMARARSKSGLKAVVLSLEESADIDSTAFECLQELDQALAHIGIALLLVRVKTTVRDLLGRWDPERVGRADRMFWSVADGVEFASNCTPSAGVLRP